MAAFNLHCAGCSDRTVVKPFRAWVSTQPSSTVKLIHILYLARMLSKTNSITTPLAYFYVIIEHIRTPAECCHAQNICNHSKIKVHGHHSQTRNVNSYINVVAGRHHGTPYSKSSSAADTETPRGTAFQYLLSEQTQCFAQTIHGGTLRAFAQLHTCRQDSKQHICQESWGRSARQTDDIPRSFVTVAGTSSIF